MKKRFRDKPPCDELGPGDGVDPRLEPKGRKTVLNRKALQLCAQVARELNLALASSADDLLRTVYVEAVIPAPDSMHLLARARSSEDPEVILDLLRKASGHLRGSVAYAIHRKKVPEVRWEVYS